MKHATLAASVAACLCAGLTVPFSAALTPVAAAETPAPGAKTVPAAAKTSDAKSAEVCLTDLTAFNAQMRKDGYWMGASGYGYGYPMAGYPGSAVGGDTGGGYWNVRPGYDVRTLVSAANILAHRGDQQTCEAILATTRDVYQGYAAAMRSGNMPIMDGPNWQKQQIAAAKPVAGSDSSFRSDQFLGTEVLNLQGETLGSVEDLVTSPQSGKIAYLVVGRGGVFGFDEKYVPVPWEDFKVTPGANLIVLDALNSSMDAAPHVNEDQFAIPGQFDQESKKVDAFWKTHLTSN